MRFSIAFNIDEGGRSVVLFVSPISFIDIQNRYLLNVEREREHDGRWSYKRATGAALEIRNGCFGVYSTEEEKRDIEK